MPKTQEQLYEEAERAFVQEAIGETEQEIFDDALNRDPDDNDGDRSLEEIDGEDVLDDDDPGEGEESDGDETGEQEGDGEGEGDETRLNATEEDQRGQVSRGGVPPGRLREEAEGRRVAEAENRELRARIEALERNARPAQPVQEQPKPQEPDMFADPQGWAKFQEAKIIARVVQPLEEQRINASFADAEEEHGDTFRTAFQDLQKSGNPGLVRSIVGSHNPGKTLMRWHQQQALLADIGNDPAAYRDKVRQELLADPEVRKAVISGARSEAMRGDGSGQARTQVRLPPSLNSATGGTSHRGEGRMNGGGRDTARTNRSIEQEIFDSAFED